MNEHRDKRTVLRMTLLQRIDHALLALFLLLLIASGLALAYHDQAWAKALIGLMGGIKGRGILHRTAAIGLVFVGLVHFGGLLFSERHQSDFRALWFKRSDLTEAWRGWVYGLTGKGKPPYYGRFRPMQKIQYWGILVGCLVMAVSGFVLWSPQASLAVFPKYVYDLMLVIHSEEAQLIFVLLILWHLYDVHVAGGNFPMNTAWLTGRIKADQFKNQHPAEWDRLEKEERE
ncbi:MAG: cytochrome b/b6 domain-containing protein [Acidobacteriota bacterium]|jgi:formate dehydrogenase subunit gamma